MYRVVGDSRGVIAADGRALLAYLGRRRRIVTALARACVGEKVIIVAVATAVVVTIIICSNGSPTA